MYLSSSITPFITSVVFPSLAAIAVAFRFYARRYMKLSLELDDWLILLSLVLVITIGATTSWALWHGGLGGSPQNITPALETIFLELVLVGSLLERYLHLGLIALQVGNLLTILCLGTIKISVLQFYKRIFKTRKFVRSANTIIFLVILWMIIYFFLYLFAKGKASNLWSLENLPYHFNFDAMGITGIVTDIALDIVVLSFPFPMIWKLQMTTERKLALVGVFWLGGCCVIASIVRLAYDIESAKDYSQLSSEFASIAINITIWSQIEPCISIIAACLPPLSPLLKNRKIIPRWIAGVRSYISQHSFLNVSEKLSERKHNSDNGIWNKQPSGSGWVKIPPKKQEEALELKHLEI